MEGQNEEKKHRFYQTTNVQLKCGCIICLVQSPCHHVGTGNIIVIYERQEITLTIKSIHFLRAIIN